MAGLGRLHLVTAKHPPAIEFAHYILPRAVRNLLPPIEGRHWPQAALPFEKIALEADGILSREERGDDLESALILFEPTEIPEAADGTLTFGFSLWAFDAGEAALSVPGGRLALWREEEGLKFGIHLGDIQNHVDDDLTCAFGSTISHAIFDFLALLETRGIAQERVEAPAKLNKKRLANGKPAIQPYIRLVVGQVYDRGGNETPEHERRHVRPHIRAGHSRRQHHGPQNSLLKTVHIPPTVVNYGAGDILPDRPRVFVLAKEKRHVMALGESIH